VSLEGQAVLTHSTPKKKKGGLGQRGQVTFVLGNGESNQLGPKEEGEGGGSTQQDLGLKKTYRN